MILDAYSKQTEDPHASTVVRSNEVLSSTVDRLRALAVRIAATLGKAALARSSSASEGAGSTAAPEHDSGLAILLDPRFLSWSFAQGAAIPFKMGLKVMTFSMGMISLDSAAHRGLDRRSMSQLVAGLQRRHVPAKC